jgi:hypothetical protein
MASANSLKLTVSGQLQSYLLTVLMAVVLCITALQAVRGAI